MALTQLYNLTEMDQKTSETPFRVGYRKENILLEYKKRREPSVILRDLAY